MKQTAVEWLLEQCPRIETVSAYNILEQAKAMEKDHIVDAHIEGQRVFDNYTQFILNCHNNKYLLGYKSFVIIFPGSSFVISSSVWFTNFIN